MLLLVCTFVCNYNTNIYQPPEFDVDHLVIGAGNSPHFYLVLLLNFRCRRHWIGGSESSFSEISEEEYVRSRAECTCWRGDKVRKAIYRQEMRVHLIYVFILARGTQRSSTQVRQTLHIVI